MEGPAVDESEVGENEMADFEWNPAKENERILANSPEYQELLLQYTMNMLPSHRDPLHAVNAHTGSDEDANPAPYDFHQIDIIVPASGQDERLMILAERLGIALSNFKSWYEEERKPAILRRIKQEEEEKVTITVEEGQGGESKSGSGKADSLAIETNKKESHDSTESLDLRFRLLVTRYPQDKQKTEEDIAAFRKALSEKTTLSEDNIELVRVGQNDPDMDEDEPIIFNRANARNMLHENACHEDYCIVTAFDVDMQVLPIFFHRAMKVAKPGTKAYFPIVFSEFNPETVQKVQDFLQQSRAEKRKNNEKDDNKSNNSDEEEESDLLPPFSVHRGLWRDFGYGMYALAGSDVERLRFNEGYKGWGHEDNDFYKLVYGKMKVHREREHGLIHLWHPKNCNLGVDITTKEQWNDCLNSRNVMEGSILGLLLREPLPTHSEGDFPGAKTDSPNKKSDSATADGEAEKEKDDGDGTDGNSNENGNNDKAGGDEDGDKEDPDGESERDKAAESKQNSDKNDHPDGNSRPQDNKDGDSETERRR